MTPPRKPRRGGPASDIPGRLAAFFDRLAAVRADAAVLDGRDDAFYLSGYTGSDAVVVLDVLKRRGWLVTDSRYIEEAAATAPGLEAVTWRDGFAAFVGGMLRKFGYRVIAYTPETLSTAFFLAMRKAAGSGLAWRDAGPGLARLRSVKSPGEVKAIEKALACAQGAFLAARGRWRAGMAEMEIRNDLEWEMRRRGAEDTAFETIVAAGANASLPHAHAGGGTLRPGGMLLIDFGARVARYNSDLTRTLWVGHIPAVWLRRYRAVLAAREAGVAALRAGVGQNEPDRAARVILAGEGLAERFTHSLGHGVGLAVHEEPRLSYRSAEPLAANQVVTVEPGIYFPGSGGIRVEDMVLVREGGRRMLSDLPRDEDSLVI